jgi:hypothetical protein
MTKNINLISETATNSPILGFENISIQNIDSIYSCSADNITCNIFSQFDTNAALQMLNTMLDKIKPKGQLILSLTNLKRVAKLYSNGNISDKDFFQIIKNTHNPINYYDIINSIKNQPNITIVNLKKDNINTYIILTKTGI